MYCYNTILNKLDRYFIVVTKINHKNYSKYCTNYYSKYNIFDMTYNMSM